MDKFCLTLIPGIFAAAAFIVTLFGGIYCRFLTISSIPGTEEEEPVTLQFGIWYYQSWVLVDSDEGPVAYQTCYKYPDATVFDAKWKSAKAFSTMAMIIGAIVGCLTLCAGCLYPTRKMYFAASMAYMICCLFTGLTLLMLDSNACNNNELVNQLAESEDITFQDSCSAGIGAKCILSSTVMWFAAAIGMLVAKPPQRSRVNTDTDEGRQHDKTYEQMEREGESIQAEPTPAPVDELEEGAKEEAVQ
jgi:hypothetical protein